MDEQASVGFLIALGEEFCEVLSRVIGDDAIVPQDGYEIFYQTFHQKPRPTMLASLSEEAFEQLRANCEEYFECPGITLNHMRSITTQTLARWPVDSIL